MVQAYPENLPRAPVIYCKIGVLQIRIGSELAFHNGIMGEIGLNLYVYRPLQYLIS